MDLESLIAEVLPSMPPGTRIVDVTRMYDTDRMLDARTDYEESLRPPDMRLPHLSGGAPVLHTRISFSPADDVSAARRALVRLAERHNEEWQFIHSPAYAAALAKTVARG